MTAYRFFDFFAAFFAFFAFFAIGLIPPFRLGYAEGEPRHRVASAAWHSARVCRLPFSLWCARSHRARFRDRRKGGAVFESDRPVGAAYLLLLGFLGLLGRFLCLLRH